MPDVKTPANAGKQARARQLFRLLQTMDATSEGFSEEGVLFRLDVLKTRERILELLKTSSSSYSDLQVSTTPLQDRKSNEEMREIFLNTVKNAHITKARLLFRDLKNFTTSRQKHLLHEKTPDQIRYDIYKNLTFAGGYEHLQDPAAEDKKSIEEIKEHFNQVTQMATEIFGKIKPKLRATSIETIKVGKNSNGEPYL